MVPFEAKLKQRLESEGYKVLNSGWPDFCAVAMKDGEIDIRLIEAKGNGDKLRTNQAVMHAVLKLLGIPVEVVYETEPHSKRRTCGVKSKRGGWRIGAGRRRSAVDAAKAAMLMELGESSSTVAKQFGINVRTLQRRMSER